MGSAAKIARYGVLCGIVALLVTQAIHSSPLGVWQDRLFMPLALALAGVIFVLPALMPGAATRLLRHRRLLAPLLVLALIEASIALFTEKAAAHWLLQPFPLIDIGVLRITLTLVDLFAWLIRVAYASWVTLLVLRVIRERAVGSLTDFTAVRRFYVRVACILLVGWSVPFFAALAAMGIATTYPATGTFVLITLGVVILVWNLLTAAMLPVGMDERLHFREAISRGLCVSRQGLGRWWFPVTFQLLLLGLWSYPAWTVDNTGLLGHRFDWQVHALWVGGYESHCHWCSDLQAALRVRPLPFVTTLLALACGVYAVALKLHIAGRLPPGVYVRQPRAEVGQAVNAEIAKP